MLKCSDIHETGTTELERMRETNGTERGACTGCVIQGEISTCSIRVRISCQCRIRQAGSDEYEISACIVEVTVVVKIEVEIRSAPVSRGRIEPDSCIADSGR